jgi:ABC-2 type transport system permease protein
MLTYLVVASMIRPLIGSIMDFAIEEDVRSGRIGNIITKPVSYPLFRLFKGFSSPILSLGINVFPIFLISIFFIGISMPVDFLSFSVSVVLGFFVSYLLVFLTGMWAFWSEGGIWGIKLSKDIISDILSGSIVPLYLFPEWIANIAKMLPFQAMFNIPISIYLGKIAGVEILYSFLQQLFWIAALGSISYIVWKQAEKKVIAHGG